jgi:hypothetical protein
MISCFNSALLAVGGKWISGDRLRLMANTAGMVAAWSILALAIGCASASSVDLQRRAAFDLDCKDEIKIVSLGSDVRGARGCGRKATYVERCNGQPGHVLTSCAWTLDSGPTLDSNATTSAVGQGQLGQVDIDEGMRPIHGAATECFVKHKAMGEALLVVNVSAEGTVASVDSSLYCHCCSGCAVPQDRKSPALLVSNLKRWFSKYRTMKNGGNGVNRTFTSPVSGPRP